MLVRESARRQCLTRSRPLRGPAPVWLIPRPDGGLCASRAPAPSRMSASPSKTRRGQVRSTSSSCSGPPSATSAKQPGRSGRDASPAPRSQRPHRRARRALVLPRRPRDRSAAGCWVLGAGRGPRSFPPVQEASLLRISTKTRPEALDPKSFTSSSAPATQPRPRAGEPLETGAPGSNFAVATA